MPNPAEKVEANSNPPVEDGPPVANVEHRLILGMTLVELVMESVDLHKFA